MNWLFPFLTMKKSKINPLKDNQQALKIGFWGTGPKNLYGNIYFGQIAQRLGVAPKNIYVQNGGVHALKDFFSAIDRNGNRKLSADEIASLEVEVCGYSWGAIAAIGFCQRLSTAGTIVVGGTPKNPIAFEIGAPVRIKRLFVIDPVPILNSPGVVPSTVDSFFNFYQTNGGDGIMRSAQNHDLVVEELGTVLSRLFKGTFIETKASKSKQFDIGAEKMTASDGVCFANGSETNHDTIGWFVAANLSANKAGIM